MNEHPTEIIHVILQSASEHTVCIKQASVFMLNKALSLSAFPACLINPIELLSVSSIAIV